MRERQVSTDTIKKLYKLCEEKKYKELDTFLNKYNYIHFDQIVINKPDLFIENKRLFNLILEFIKTEMEIENFISKLQKHLVNENKFNLLKSIVEDYKYEINEQAFHYMRHEAVADDFIDIFKYLMDYKKEEWQIHFAIFSIAEDRQNKEVILILWDSLNEEAKIKLRRYSPSIYNKFLKIFKLKDNINNF